VLLHRRKITEFKRSYVVNAKILPIFYANRNAAGANALKSKKHTDTVPFLTIGKLDIYKHKSVSKPAADFYLSI
jgi:hypothetical protein